MTDDNIHAAAAPRNSCISQRSIVLAFGLMRPSTGGRRHG
jgi:hypothetical protein